MNEKIKADPLPEVFRVLQLDKDEAVIVEKILREEVFHSTLDCQAEEQLIGGAIRAFNLFKRNKSFYRAAHTHSHRHFELKRFRSEFADAELLAVAEASLEEARLDFPIPASA